MKHYIGNIFLLMCFLMPVGSYTQSFIIYHTGSQMETITSPLGGTCMMGGRRENNEAMKWFLNRADGGDVVVLRASGSDGYNDYFYDELGVKVNSVTSIVFKNRKASFNDTIIDILQKAEAVWMAGGNQWKYVQFWRNSPVDSILNDHITNKNIAIGGTSAGMAVLGSIYFAASEGTVTSEECLSDPNNAKITIDTSPFLDVPFMNNVITDTHYDERNRQGRHAVFIAHSISRYGINARGIACDEYTSLCIDNHGIARAYGNHPTKDDQVYFIQLNPENDNLTNLDLKKEEPFSWETESPPLRIYKLPGTNDGSYSFNLNNWEEGVGGKWLSWSIIKGVIIQYTYS